MLAGNEPAGQPLSLHCDDLRVLVVVEGGSDQIAVEALAERRGIDLAAARIRVTPLGGAHRIGRFLEELDARDGLGLACLCDEREAPVFRSALERTGFDASLYVCVED